MNTRLVTAVAAVSALAASVMVMPIAAAAAPLERQVPALDGRYGYVEPTDPELMAFKVRNRRIINPRISIMLRCVTDGTEVQDVVYGVTENMPTRRINIPRDGDGGSSWRQEFDSSLVPNADIDFRYTFRRGRATLASVSVTANYTDTANDKDGVPVTHSIACDGVRSFRLVRGPLGRG